MSPTVGKWQRAMSAAAVFSVAAGLIALVVWTSPGSMLPSGERTSSPSTAEAGNRNRIHGAMSLGDRLDDPAEPSLGLSEAVSRSGLEVYLPDSNVAGHVVKVVLNETVEDPTGKGRIGLMVLYDTGVKLIVEPGAADLRKRNESLRQVLPFRDGRELPFDLKSVAGRPTLVSEFGIQYQGDTEIAVPADMMWTIGEATYWLRAPVDGPHEATNRGLSRNPRMQSIGTDDLGRIVTSMAPASERL